MSKKVLEKNLASLRGRQPELAAALEGRRVRGGELETVRSRVGNLVVHRRRGRLLHSQWDPLREAARWARERSPRGAFVFGFGDGYHLEALLDRSGEEGWVVVEPDLELLRSVLEERDLSRVLCRVTLLAGEPPARAAEGLAAEGRRALIHPPSGQIHRRYLESLQAHLSYRREPGRLRILVGGPVYGGSYPVACHVRDALRSLGHEVAFVDLAAFHPGYHEILALDREGGLLAALEDLLSRLLEARVRDFSPDLVLLLAQAPVTEKTLSRFRGEGIPVAYWFVEDYRRMPYWRRIAPLTDAFFVIQREAIQVMREAGVPAVHYLPLAAMEGVHEPVVLTAEERRRYGSEVSFVGAGYPNRRRFFARLAPSLDLKIWGNEWDGAPTLLKDALQDGGRRVSTEETVKIFNAARINLNLHSSSYHEEVDPHGDFVNPRTFEIAACGAFQLVDERSLLSELFQEGEVATFRDVKEAKEKIEYFLSRDEHRAEIARKGRGRVLGEHTYRLRLQEMLGRLFEQGLRPRSRGRRLEEVLAEVEDPGLRRLLASLPGETVPELEEIAAGIRGKEEISREERILLTLAAFKEEAGCGKSCSST